MDSLNNPKSALKRLNRDHINFLKQKKCFRFCSIYQDPNNGLNFHANFFHKELKVIHFIMKFPLNYPFSPPKIDLYGYIKHDNLLYYNNPYTLPFICLDILKERDRYTPNFTGWSSAYDISSILIQFYSFLFDDRVEQDYGGVYNNNLDYMDIINYKKSVKNLVIKIGEYKHTFNNPFPYRPLFEFSIDSENFPPLTDITKIKYINKLKDLSIKNEEIILNEDVINIILNFLPIASYKYAKPVSKHWNFYLNQIDFKKSIICFHSKSNLEESSIGIGINIGFKKDGNIKFILTDCDYLSYNAFNNGVRMSVWNNKFTHFIPLAINKSNFTRGFPILINSLKNIYKKNIISSLEILDFFSSFMNNIVVELFKIGKRQKITRHYSEKALICYTCIHHLLLKVILKYPKIIELVDKKIKMFLHQQRNKNYIPDLGKFLIYLAIHPKYTWNDIWADYLKETFIRNVYWMTSDKNKCYELLNLKLNLQRRLNLTFLHPNCKTSRNLISFQVYFLNNFASPIGKTHKDILQNYKYTYGRPKKIDLINLQKYCIKLKYIKTWDEYFNILNVKIPNKKQLFEVLIDSIKISEKLKYHNSTIFGSYTKIDRRKHRNR
jgi:ubiquitin-protein ligase